MQGGYTADDYSNVLGLIEFAWREGGVRSEAQASAFHGLKMKTQQILNPQPTAAPAPAGGKKKDDCCGGEHKGKEVEKPKGPPQAGTGDEKKEAPKEEAKT